MRAKHICGGPPGTRTPNLRIKSPLLCQIELEARRSVTTGARPGPPPTMFAGWRMWGFMRHGTLMPPRRRHGRRRRYR